MRFKPKPRDDKLSSMESCQVFPAIPCSNFCGKIRCLQQTYRFFKNVFRFSLARLSKKKPKKETEKKQIETVTKKDIESW